MFNLFPSIEFRKSNFGEKKINLKQSCTFRFKFQITNHNKVSVKTYSLFQNPLTFFMYCL